MQVLYSNLYTLHFYSLHKETCKFSKALIQSQNVMKESDILRELHTSDNLMEDYCIMRHMLLSLPSMINYRFRAVLTLSAGGCSTWSHGGKIASPEPNVLFILFIGNAMIILYTFKCGYDLNYFVHIEKKTAQEYDSRESTMFKYYVYTSQFYLTISYN